jgi:hypothetical protein
MAHDGKIYIYYPVWPKKVSKKSMTYICWKNESLSVGQSNDRWDKASLSSSLMAILLRMFVLNLSFSHEISLTSDS